MGRIEQFCVSRNQIFWLVCAFVALAFFPNAGCNKNLLKDGFFTTNRSAADALNEGLSGSQWIESYDEALRLSATTGKPILADFTGTDWCVWCKRLNFEVFEEEKFKSWAAENVVLLHLDFPQHGRQPEKIREQNERLAKDYKIETYPTIVFMNSSGAEIGRMGYAPGGPKAWIRKAELLISPQRPAGPSN